MLSKVSRSLAQMNSVSTLPEEKSHATFSRTASRTSVLTQKNTQVHNHSTLARAKRVGGSSCKSLLKATRAASPHVKHTCQTCHAKQRFVHVKTKRAQGGALRDFTLRGDKGHFKKNLLKL